MIDILKIEKEIDFLEIGLIEDRLIKKKKIVITSPNLLRCHI